MLKYLLWFVLLVILGQSKCKDSPAGNDSDAKANLERGAIALSGEFLYQLSQSRPDENFVTSATILILLAQTALFAKNLVLKQLLNVLSLNSKDEIKRAFLQETANYKNQEQIELDMVTNFYANDIYPLTDEFIYESEKYFDASGENVDFSESYEAADIINEWVENKTHGRIQNIVSPDSLDENTIVVLVNANYFLGNWEHQFNPNDTQKRNFTKRNNDVVQLDTMYQENTFRYSEIPELRIQALEMPYKNNNFSCLVILPKEDAFDDTISALQNPNTFINITNSLDYELVQVHLPKMILNTKMNMAEMLQNDNVTAMFNPNCTDFYGISQNDQPLYISSAVQKASMQVNETGTEAAAATDIIFSVGEAVIDYLVPVSLFDANHSFIIYNLFQGVPIFSGAFIGAD